MFCWVAIFNVLYLVMLFLSNVKIDFIAFKMFVIKTIYFNSIFVCNFFEILKIDVYSKQIESFCFGLRGALEIRVNFK